MEFWRSLFSVRESSQNPILSAIHCRNLHELAKDTRINLDRGRFGRIDAQIGRDLRSRPCRRSAEYKTHGQKSWRSQGLPSSPSWPGNLYPSYPGSRGIGIAARRHQLKRKETCSEIFAGTSARHSYRVRRITRNANCPFGCRCLATIWQTGFDTRQKKRHPFVQCP